MVDLSVSQMETIYSERQLEELSRQNVQHARGLGTREMAVEIRG